MYFFYYQANCCFEDLTLIDLRVNYKYIMYLRQTEQCAHDPGHREQESHPPRCFVLADWIQDGETSVDANDDDDVGGQVETEHLQELDELAHGITCVPLDG